MYICFEKIKISNFQSIKTANIDIDNQGIVKVEGINNYETNADSNGSGKSSCFEALTWALYGKTSNGISDPTNRYGTGTCAVELLFTVEGNNYRIERSTKAVKLFCNDNDITSKNKTDTDKQIRELIPFSQDVFLSTVFLSQGFNARLSTLTPSGRKERIENLSGISDKIEAFKSNISNIKAKLNNDITELNNKLSYNQGYRESLYSSIDETINKINKITSESNGEIDIEECREKLSAIREKIEKLNSERNEYNNSLQEILVYENTINSQIQTATANKNTASKKLESLKINCCPTCHQTINADKVAELKNEYNQVIAESESTISTESVNADAIKKKIQIIRENIHSREDKIRTLKESVSEMEQKLKKYENTASVDNLREIITNAKAKILDLTSEIEKDKKDCNEIEDYHNIATQCLNLTTKQFRTYLLNNIINFINSKLSTYSTMLFSNKDDIIVLDTDSNKLNITLGDNPYESLSGGEKRKVDLAITFVQRDLLLNIAGISTNIVILDEVMDHMDQSATTATLSMISYISDSVSSMFIISHNNYELPFEKVMTVTKETNRCSTIKIS